MRRFGLLGAFPLEAPLCISAGNSDRPTPGLLGASSELERAELGAMGRRASVCVPAGRLDSEVTKQYATLPP